jgi:hypothetical protein
MRRKTTASVEASTTVSLAYAWEYGFGRTSGHAYSLNCRDIVAVQEAV